MAAPLLAAAAKKLLGRKLRGAPHQSNRRWLIGGGIAVGLLPVMVLLAITSVVIALLGGTTSSTTGATQQQSQSGSFNSAAVPPEFLQGVLAAGALCPEIGPALIAAQVEQESGWDPNADSGRGAYGLTQFLNGTWAEFGGDYNNNGSARPVVPGQKPAPGTNQFDPYDALVAQGTLMCYNVEQLKARGYTTNLVYLALSAYFGGLGTVYAADGDPNKFPTAYPFEAMRDYAPKILAKVAKYGSIGAGGGGGGPVVADGTYAPVIAAAMAQLGVPYNFGGGSINGPTGGQEGPYLGFDCSSLLQYAFYQGTGKTLIIPRTTLTQGMAYWHPGNDGIDLKNPPVGAVLWFYGTPGTTSGHHVALYVGNNQIIEAPGRGRAVRLAPYVDGVAHNLSVRGNVSYVPATGAALIPLNG